VETVGRIHLAEALLPRGRRPAGRGGRRAPPRFLT
jgi:hypothetical protein